MNTSENYHKVAAAIDFIRQNQLKQPNLDEIAAAIHLSPTHFQRIFTEWAGVSPKKFLQYINLDYARAMLRGEQATLFDTTLSIGLSSPGRLHDLFVNIDGMTPAEYKNGGDGLGIQFHSYPTIFGNVLVASTLRGICYMAFADDTEVAVKELQFLFPDAKIIEKNNVMHQQAIAAFSPGFSSEKLKLHLKGTPFQIKVWEALLQIPSGKFVSYGQLAAQLGNPTAARAVGTAVGDNPIAYLIPCHRVIQSSGNFGQYHWGSTRKATILGWEAAQRGDSI